MADGLIVPSDRYVLTDNVEPRFDGDNLEYEEGPFDGGKSEGNKCGDGDRKDVGDLEKGLEIKYLSLKASTHQSMKTGH